MCAIHDLYLKEIVAPPKGKKAPKFEEPVVADDDAKEEAA